MECSGLSGEVGKFILRLRLNVNDVNVVYRSKFGSSCCSLRDRSRVRNRLTGELVRILLISCKRDCVSFLYSSMKSSGKVSLEAHISFLFLR